MVPWGSLGGSPTIAYHGYGSNWAVAGNEGRCFGAVLDMAPSGASGVRVVLRSLEGGHGGTAPSGGFMRGIPLDSNQ